MSQKEAVTLRYAYYYESKSGIQTPLPGSIYDGSFLSGYTGGNEVIFAVAQARSDTHAGRYLLNSTGGPAVRPVIDPDITDDYKQYLPE